VVQRNKKTGCIPSSIEWMLRYLKIEGIDFDGFQEKFDLEIAIQRYYENRPDKKNTGGDVCGEVKKVYPQTSFKCDKPFKNGEEKLSFIKELIKKGIPVTVSLYRDEKKVSDTKIEVYCHIMPVVKIGDNTITVLDLSKEVDQEETYQKSDIIRQHDELPWGKDIIHWNKGRGS